MSDAGALSPIGPARLDIPLDAPGRHVGAMRIPFSRDASAYGQVVVPVCCVVGGAGPTVLLTAGVHGDEYEGQIELARLARTLDPAGLTGRVIIVPMLHPAAALAGRRTSPHDGGNLARLFPGAPTGTLTNLIAEGVTRLLLPAADVVLDLHSGGRSLDYTLCAFGRLPADEALAARTLDLLCAFGAPATVVMDQPEARGTLVAEALAMGKPAMATELAGGGGVTPTTLALAARGIRNVLAMAGVIASTGTPAPTTLYRVAPTHFLRAPGRGLFAPGFALGDRVAAGDIAGHLIDPERLDRPFEPLVWPESGTVLCRRIPAMTEAGDVLAHLGAVVTRDAMLRR